MSILLPHCSRVRVIALFLSRLPCLVLLFEEFLPHADRVSQSHHSSSPIWDTYRLFVAPLSSFEQISCCPHGGAGAPLPFGDNVRMTQTERIGSKPGLSGVALSRRFGGGMGVGSWAGATCTASRLSLRERLLMEKWGVRGCLRGMPCSRMSKERGDRCGGNGLSQGQ